MIRTVYHTVRATSDVDALLKNAPFLCKNKSEELKEWLGEGFYFWETFILLPHWWGTVKYKHRGEDYIILRTIFNCPDNEILDLVSDTEMMEDIAGMIEEMRKNPLFDATKFTAQFVINFIRTKTPFKFKAIRAYGRDSSRDPLINERIYFFNQRSSIHLCPEIQICVIDPSVIRLPMEIVYDSREETLAE